MKMIFTRIIFLCCAIAIVTSDRGWMRRRDNSTRGVTGYNQNRGSPAFGGRNRGPSQTGPFGGSSRSRSSRPGLRGGPPLPPKLQLPGPPFGQRRSPFALRPRIPPAPARIGLGTKRRRISTAVRLGRMRALLQNFIKRICLGSQRQLGENNDAMKNEENRLESKRSMNASTGIDNERSHRYGRDNDVDDDSSRRGRGRMGRRGGDDANKRGPGWIARKVGNKISRRQDRRKVVSTVLKAFIMKNQDQNDKKEEEDDKPLKDLVEKLLDVLNDDDEEDEGDGDGDDEDLDVDDGSGPRSESDSSLGVIEDLDTSE